MKIRIITHDDERIIVKNTIIKLGVNPFDTEGSKVPISLFKDKGDILAAKGASNPATIKAGSDGQVLVSDSTEEAGVKWQTQKIGTITLLNSESSTVPSGMVVTPGTDSGTFRVAKSSDTENLYVTSENILSGKYGVLYATNGVSCSVRVTEGAIAIGDKLAVSAIDGIAQATTGDHFAIAVISKSAGQVGVVSCILANSNSSVLNAYPIGSIYMSVNPTNPSNYFGGTWVAWGTGRIPVGIDTSQTEFNTVEKTGGEKTHTLTVAEMPAHTHRLYANNEAPSVFNNTPYAGTNDFSSNEGRMTYAYWGSSSTKKFTAIETVGGNGSHNNLQPYIVCYMWKRTA